MGIYKTYREAVLAKGSTEGIYTPHKEWTGKDKSWIGQFVTKGTLTVPMVGYGKWVECNPADHLETMYDFSKKGLKLIEGDKYTGRDGNVVNVKTYNLSTANTPLFGDEKRFVVKATAYDTETPEEKEVFDDIEKASYCEVSEGSLSEAFYVISKQVNQQLDSLIESLSSADKPNSSEWDGEGLPPVGVEFDFSSNGGYWERRTMLFNDGITCLMANSEYPTNRWHYKCEDPDIMLRKTETPAEREERERLEAAYHLYCKCGIQHDTVSFEKFKGGDDCYPEVWLDIVNETGYRKKESK